MAAPAFDKFVKTISSFSDDVFNHANKSWNGIDMSLDEPEIIRDYLIRRDVGIDYLNKNLAPILSQSAYEVKFASVFIHQKPRVVRTAKSIAVCSGSTPRCELGDLLIVFCFLDALKNPIHCTAVLSQAKKTEKLTSESQTCLYESDMEFDMPATIYEHSIIDSARRILPDFSEGRTKALTYSILEPHPHMCHVPWSAHISADWGVSLERILIGDLGLEFKGPVVNPDWNCIIHDLVDIGTGAIPSSTLRGNALEDVVNIFNDFNEYEKYSAFVENRPGVPMMFVIVRDKETYLNKEQAKK